ncbi:MAG: M20/M25/M40 family metallo-hydrolase [Rubrivivax sp.]|nr:M20/M25/M40 family metallo-hydrolase [Rubrivivax sp.]
MKRRALLQGVSLLPLWPHGVASAQTMAYDPADLRHAEALRDAALRDTEALALVTQLATGIGARPAGSEADARAVRWAQDAARRLGLQAVRAEPVPLRIWQRGPGSAQLVAPVQQPLVMAALGNSVPTPEAGLEAEVAWYPDLAALMADTSDRAKGRIVFLDQKTERTRDGSGYGRAVGARINGPVEAARRGAVALALRSIGTDRERIAHTGATRYDLRVPRIPAFAVSVPDAERIAQLHAEGATLRLRVALQARSDVEALTHNVIAEVPGSDLAAEIVLIGAHLDSWDLGQGAVDDGAGVAIVTAAAALIARSRRVPRRTVRVVLFGNEENGFDGARAYGDRYSSVPHQLVGESDFGAGRVWQLASRVQPAALPLVAQLATVLAPMGVAAGTNDGSPGPDAALLMRRHRWPALQLGQDGTRYFDVHHTEHDRIDQIEPDALAQNVACWAATAWLAAQAPLPFGPPTL